MTFRTRLVMAATIAVLLAVLLGSISAYVVAHNSLVGSIDNTLSQDAQSILLQQRNAIDNGSYLQVPNACNSSTFGECEQVVYSDGGASPLDPQVLPINDTVKRVAASGGSGPSATLSVTIHTNKTTAVRMAVVPLPGGWLYRG
ncbi:MAG: hypothetical protein ACRDWB_01685, partial [Acidimicrobiales bacterium]